MAAGEEVLDPGQDRVGIGEPGRVVRAVDLEQPRARDVVAEVPAALHRNGVLAGMDDEGRRGDRRQDRPDVDPERRFECRARHPRAGAHALQHSELAYRPHRRQQTFECCTAAPRRADGAAELLQAGDLLRRRRVVLTQFGKKARPQLGRVAVDVVPPGEAGERERAVEDQRPRSLRSFCREDHGGRTALAHTEDGRFCKADGVDDRLDLGRSLFEQTNFRDGVRQPDPRLVEHEDPTERGELLEEGLELGQGPKQLDVGGHRPDEDELDRPVAEHLIRQAQIAARCVRRFRHSMSVVIPGATTPDFGALRAASAHRTAAAPWSTRHSAPMGAYATVDSTRSARSAPRAVSWPARRPASSGRTALRGSAKRVRSTGPGTSALVWKPSPPHRSAAAPRAACTRARTVAVSSAWPAEASAVTGNIRARRSTRSSSGPDSRPRYRRRTSEGQTQSRSWAGAHGQGLAARTSWNRAGYCTVPSALASRTSPSSSGVRSASSRLAPHSGASSRKRTPK